MALCSSTAATEESTPPESPSTTLSSPSFSRSSRTVASTKLSDVHSCLQPQMPATKFFSSCVPSVEWYTSGWNWMPHVCSPPTWKAATRTSSVLATIL